MVDSSGLPWFATNLKVAGADTQPPWLRSSVLFERGGIKIGVFGLITKYLRGMVTDSLLGAARHPALRRAGARRNRRDCGGRARISSSGLNHVGYNHDRYLSDSVPGIDVIIGAHSHTGLRPPFESPRNHTISPAGLLQAELGRVCSTFPSTPRRARSSATRAGWSTCRARRYPWTFRTWPNSNRPRAVAEIGYDEVLGVSKRELTRGGAAETPAGNLITDAMREYFKADLAFHNSAGIRANIPAGAVTYRDVYQVDIFGNTAVTGMFTGSPGARDLRSVGQRPPRHLPGVGPEDGLQ